MRLLREGVCSEGAVPAAAGVTPGPCSLMVSEQISLATSSGKCSWVCLHIPCSTQHEETSCGKLLHCTCKQKEINTMLANHGLHLIFKMS